MASLDQVLARCATVEDLRDLARRRLPEPIFDFIDGAAFRERTLAANIADFGRYRLRQRVLVDVGERSTATTILGQAAAMPAVIAPTGMSGAIPGGGRGELQAARAAAAARIPYTLGMLSMTRIGELADAVGAPWFQMCLLKDRAITEGLLREARAAGVPVLMLTVTWPLPSQMNRSVRGAAGGIPPKWTPRVVAAYARKPGWALRTLLGRPLRLRNLEPHLEGSVSPRQVVGMLDASLGWHDVAWLRDRWPNKLVIKGITEPEDADHAVRLGVDGISVSNHGGNQLDETASTISLLPDVAAAVGGRIAVYLDGGIRSGQDILKALALGADACLIGRAHLYGLGAGGERGVSRVLQILQTELSISAGLSGLRAVEAVGPHILHPPIGGQQGQAYEKG